MKNYIILLPQVYEKMSYYYQNNVNGVQFIDYLKSCFNPDDRGLLISKLEDNSTKIKVWSKDFSLTCMEAEEEQCLKAIAVKETKPFQYHFILERGHILKGYWEFTSTDEAKYYTERNKNRSENGVAEFETAQSIIEDIENISESDEQFREFKKYQEYWENLDIIRQQQEKMLKRDKYSKLVDYSDCKADFDKGLLVFRISKNDFNFSNGERIRGCDRDCFNQNYDADSYDLDKIPSIGIGTLINYDKNNGLLFVEPYNTTLTKKFSQNENLSKGKIWIDDIGTKSILNKQKHALKKLFKKETANVKLRDFVPEVGYLLPAYGRSVDYSCFSSEFEIMTENQKQAIKSSLSCDDIYLIQGPPGTGKTTVICEIAQYLVKSNNKVLLSSQTNLGVDNVLERIGNKPNVKAIRIGREEKFERGSEQYALNRRVDDLQRNIINKMQKNREEITCINQEVFQLQNVYTAHDKVAEMLKAIVNILESYNEKLEEKHILQDRLDAELGNMLKIKECMDNFMQNHEKNLGYLEELYNIQQKSRNSLKENIIAYKVFRELELSDEDRIDVENYAMILDEIVSVIEKVKDIQNQELRFEQERQTMLQTLGMIKKQIENIKAQASSVTDGVKPHLQEMIQEKTQRSDDIILQVKEFDLELKGILSKKEDMLNHIQQLKRQALGIKQKIEYYIDTNSDLWLNVFGESRITKESFIKLFKLQDAFKEEYASVDERLELVLYLEDYEEYRFNSLYCQQHTLDIENIQNSITIVDKYLARFNEKIEQYKSDEQVICYLNYYNKTLEDINIAQDQQAIESFMDLYRQKKRRIEIYKMTEYIQREWEQKLNYYQESFENAYINVSNIICATCLGIATSQNNYFLDKEFDYVIIDEAARSSSLELLIPMIRGRKIVLVGDHKQLSPQIERDILEEIEKDNLISEDKLNEYYKKSLFGLMYDNADSQIKTFLSEQFRMHRDISYVVSHNFYNNELFDAENINSKDHSLGQYLKNGFYWVDTSASGGVEYKEVVEGTSYLNPGEAQDIKEILYWINGKLTVNKTVGIISPYSSQKNYLTEHLPQYDHLELEINTIDAFQGREKNYIIMSLVRNNDYGIMGHTANDPRINVAISRAQELLVIIGNRRFIEENRKKSGKMYKIVQHLNGKGCILDRSFFVY